MAKRAHSPSELEENASTSQQRIADVDAKTELSAESAGRRRIGAQGAINQNKKIKPHLKKRKKRNFT